MYLCWLPVNKYEMEMIAGDVDERSKRCLALFVVALIRKYINREVTVLPVTVAAVKLGVLGPMKGCSVWCLPVGNPSYANVCFMVMVQAGVLGRGGRRRRG